MKQIVKKYIKSFVVAAILVFICNILGVLHPYIMKKIIDVDFGSINIKQTLISLFVAYLTIHIFLAIMKDVRNYQNNALMANILRDVREKLFRKILKLKMKTFSKYNSSEIYTRLTVDVENIFQLFFGVIQILVNNVVYIILMLVMMFLANVNLALIGCASICLGAIISLKVTKKLKKLDSKILDKRDKQNLSYSEMYNKNKLTYLFGLQKNNIIGINKLLDEELKERKKYIFLNHFVFPISLIIDAIRNICNVILCLKYKC